MEGHRAKRDAYGMNVAGAGAIMYVSKNVPLLCYGDPTGHTAALKDFDHDGFHHRTLVIKLVNCELFYIKIRE